MSNSDDQLEARERPSQLAGLNGIWFRRQRERIAMGRPAVAARLGVSVGRVTALETKNEAVPAPWWPLLPALGFQHPRLPLSSPEASPVNSEADPAPRPAPPGPVIAEQAAALQTRASSPTLPDFAQSLPAQSAGAEGEQVAATTESMQPSATTSADSPLTPCSTATQVAAPAQARLPPAPDLPRGLWLRSRRIDLGHSLKTVSKALELSVYELGVFEWQNLPVPLAWMSTLETLRFCRWTPTPASQDELEGQPTGAWLRRERQRKGCTIEICARDLGIRTQVLAMVELHGWPVPPEWLPGLAQLGFADPGDMPSQDMPRTAAHAEAVPPRQTETAQTHSQQDGADGDLNRASFAEPRKVSNQTLESHEQDDKSVTPQRRPGLRTTGSPVAPQSTVAGRGDPDAPVMPPAASTAEAMPPPGAGSAPSSAQQNGVIGQTKQPVAAQLTGAWLSVHRRKRKLTQSRLAELLSVSAWRLGDCEREDKPISSDWLSLLRKLGFPVPKPSAEGVASALPKPGPVASAVDLPLDGRWLRAERERLHLDPLKLTEALGGVTRDSIRSIECSTGRVPDSWLSTLATLGFCLPPHLAKWHPSTIAGASQLRGTWLLKARQRQKVSHERVRRAVHVHHSTLTAIEKHNRPLPADWLPALRKLGFIDPGGQSVLPPPRSKPERPQNPEPAPAGRPPASSAGEVKSSNPTAPLSPEQRRDLVETTIRYRLNMGRSTGKPAFQVLGWMLQDIQQAGLEEVITFEILHAALDALKRWRTL